MSLRDMIYKRRSCRSYKNEPVDASTIQKIKEFAAKITPLYPDIEIKSEIIDSEHVKCVLPWRSPQVIAIFSEDKEGAYENVGFVFEQLELYMQSLGLGVCWLGMGRLDTDVSAVSSSGGKLKFMMMLAFGYPNGTLYREAKSEFKRRALTEISDLADERLECVRLAPSSVNSQPWYFTHDGETIHVYNAGAGFLKLHLGDMNKMDIGIALSHVYVSNTDTFRFFKTDAPKLRGKVYVGSFTI
ncbi:MAG: nitroreductase [Clostridia bacterium]|nr:nitroreductase [Clostridia bacterium]